MSVLLNIIIIIILILIVFFVNSSLLGISEHFGTSYLDLLQYQGEEKKYKLSSEVNKGNQSNKNEKVIEDKNNKDNKNKEVKKYDKLVITKISNGNTKFLINDDQYVDIINRGSNIIVSNVGINIEHIKYNLYSSNDTIYNLMFDNNIIKIDYNDNTYYITDNLKIKFYNKIIGNIKKDNNKYVVVIDNKYNSSDDSNSSEDNNSSDDRNSNTESNKIIDKIAYGFIIHLYNQK